MAASRFATETTAGLRELTAMWEDVQRTRLAATQRGLLPLADSLKKLEDVTARDIKKQMASHPLADWFPRGLGGVHVARLVALIDDPWRFPGRRCTVGHYLSVAEVNSEIGITYGGATDVGEEDVVDKSVGIGDPCPVETHDGPCTGTLLAPRPGTGVRSLWHYCGLHVVDGRSPRKQKGKVADWNPVARTIVLMPGGIAEQIVRLRVPKYRDRYDEVKERLHNERAVDGVEFEGDSGALADGSEVENCSVSETVRGLRPIQIDAIARKVAAKQFIGDLLMEWKRRTEPRHVGVAADGPALHAHREVA